MYGSSSNPPPVRTTARWWRPLALIGMICAFFILARIFGVGDRLMSLRNWIVSLGPWAPIVYIIIYIAATVLALPGSALTVIAGAMFGSAVGVILVSISATLGASLAFLISRYFARKAVVSWLKDNPRFQKLDALSEAHGAIVVALTRLVPLFPFNILNYGFGLTRVRFRTYVFWSWLCMLPGTVLYVVGADALVKGLAEGRIPWALLGVFTVAACLVFLLVRSARKRLDVSGKPGRP